ncbi:alpha-1B-glycoprotein-like isoform X1 [Dermochelys coriacea]|uniref:alpha-1B-glycoprotein-like isoform X1 n=1 Tax=Dermochelys coriacea TaxID=27794 RepID=UPI0018E77BE4|nr:alpha-1B-glycoprotein-like isoform X1 [Dermochelys coriacea]XP_043351902.1 alpha-1B-glycoprotein-like isoform X1 [Dermochelys coriacea]
MALTLLLPVLACLQILPRPVSLADEASLKPLLTVSPEYSTYCIGNSVTFTCLTPKGHQAMQFQFLRDGAEVDSAETQSQLPHTYNLPRLNVHDSGSYRCRYWTPGQKIASKLSDPITINVYERPPPPSLSLDPPCLEYLLGEPVMLSCIDPKVGKVTGYRFYNERNGETSTYAPDPSGGAKLVFLALHMADAGPYTCKYWRAESGQEILSVGSQPVSVSVLDPPSQPSLSMDPPTGVIKEGLPLLLTCTAPRDTGERRFHFYRDGAEFIPGNTWSQISTTGQGTGSMNVSVLRIPRASPNSSGRFTCGYEEKVCQKWVPSPRSQAVNITVTADKVFLLRFLVVGGSFFIINGLIFLISHCCL